MHTSFSTPILEEQATHKSLPKEMFAPKPLLFVKKLLICFSITAIAILPIILNSNPILLAISIIVLGIMYTHVIELQHEALHEGAFKSKKLNRLIGFVLRIFTFSSFSHYKHNHLLHHIHLGTKENREFFNYRFKNLNSITGFVFGMFNLTRYVDVLRNTFLIFSSKPLKGITSVKWEKKIKSEYRLMFLILLASIVCTIYTGSFIFVFAWYLPVV